ncbi:hypothetical protein [Planctomicrobium piriforme]|uniref:Uncharacterized protein n=1 Tax=Planctomicrobium piriforme TaxID=1576369 RepID=A0A1I3F033_9PLAN|nr:hypothetical protein [Planctomicrobium piriforme]SFI04634.1 hypothetical protein SAMN05421753_10520 [Planctomicrobium piriforme]
MEPPIIVIGDALEIFDSVAAAERYLEVPDIAGLTIYDANGYVINATHERKHGPLLKCYVVLLQQAMPPRQNVEHLRKRLLGILEDMEKQEPEDCELPLPLLIGKARTWCRCD